MEGPTIVRNRNELARLLAKSLYLSAKAIKDTQKLKFELNLPKSYLVESNIGLDQFTKHITKIPQKEMGFSVKIIKTDQEELIILKAKHKEKSEVIHLYLDTFDPRIWTIHSVGPTKESDRIIRNIISRSGSKLDHTWLETKLMEKIIRKGEMREFSSSFKDIRYKNGMTINELPLEKLSIRLWGSKSERIYRILQKQELVSRGLSLNAAQIRIKMDKELETKDEEYIDERFTSTGKLVAKGTSVALHLDFLREIIAIYKSKLNQLEEKMIKEDNYFEAKPFVIKMPEEFSPKEIVKFITSKFQPFRIFGMHNRINKDYYLFYGVDLHNGDKIDLEITKKEIRAYMWEKACGNSILRLTRNMQRHLNSKITLQV